MLRRLFPVLFFLHCISCEDNSSLKLLRERIKMVKPGMSPTQASDIMAIKPKGVFIGVDSGFIWDYGTPFFGASSSLSIKFSKDSIVKYTTNGL